MGIGILGMIGSEAFSPGVYADLGAGQAPCIVDCRNVSFVAGQITPSPGLSLVLDSRKRKPLLAISSQFTFGQDRIFMSFADGVSVYGDGQILDVGDAKNVTQFAPFGNFTLAANGQALLAKRTEGGTFFPIASAPNADFVVTVSPYVLCFSERTIYWCAHDDIDNWDFANPDNDAGNLPIRDMDGDIQAVLPWGQGAAVFSNNGLWIVSYLGGTDIFGVEKARGLKTGVIGRQSVCAAQGLFYGVGQTGIWKSDANSILHIDTPQIHNKFYTELIDIKRLSEVVAWYDAANTRIVFAFPNRDGKRIALAWSLIGEGHWTILSTGFSCVDLYDTFPYQLIGTDEGYVFGQTAEPLATSQIYAGGLRTQRKVKLRFGYGAHAYGPVPYGYLSLAEDIAPGGTSANIKITYTAPDGRTSDANAVRATTSEAVWFETKDFDFGNRQWKYWDGIVFRFTNAADLGSLRYYYALRDDLGDPIVWEGPFDIEGEETHFDVRDSTRYLRLKIEDTFPRGRWILSGIEVHGMVAGGRRQ